MTTEYRGWSNCHRVTNGRVELIATGDVGPRIIRFGFTGGANLFGEIEGENDAATVFLRAGVYGFAEACTGGFRHRFCNAPIGGATAELAAAICRAAGR